MPKTKVTAAHSMALMVIRLIEAEKHNMSSNAQQPFARDDVRRLREESEKMAKTILMS